jgi:hypothetical protein
MPKFPQPIERIRTTAMEIGLYLPVGVYSKARDELTTLSRRRIRAAFSDLVDLGHERVRPFERRVRRRAKRVEEQTKETVTGAAASARERTRQVQSAAEKATRKNVKKTSAAVATAAPKLPRVAAPRSAKELPIDDYGSLNVSEITSRLGGLTQTELAKVYKYEQARQNRSTVLEAIDAKLIDLPIATYDALTAEEVIGRLESLSQDELEVLRRYEASTKSRSTVMEKIDSLLA